MTNFINFDEVKGYKTYENAKKHGEKVLDGCDLRWTVIALPNGRFAPCAFYSDKVSVNLGYLCSKNVCVAN